VSFYPELAPEAIRALLSERIDEPVLIDRLQVYRTMDPQPSVKLLELELQAVGGRR